MQRKTSLRSWAVFLTLSVVTPSAIASSYIPWEHFRDDYGRARLIPEVMLISTSQNYDTAGTKVTPTDTTTGETLKSYSQTLLNLTGTYGISPTLTMYARLQFAKANYTTGTTLNLSGNTSSLRDQTLGIAARVWKNRETLHAFDLQAEITFPAYDPVTQRASTSMLSGDGTRNMTFGGFYVYPFSMKADRQMYAEVGLGYTSRNLGFSAFAPYRADFISRATQEGLGFRAGLVGIKSLKSDPAADPNLGTPATTAVAQNAAFIDGGASFMVNALNSSYTALHGALSYRFNPQTELRGTFATALKGTSTAAWSSFGAQMEWRFGSAQKTIANPKKGPTSYGLVGRVKQVNDALSILRADIGEASGVAVGNLFSVFSVKEDGNAEDLVAVAQVTHIRTDESVLKIKHFQKQVLIQPGFIVKRIETEENKF